MSSQPCQRERGGHKLFPAFLPVPGDGPGAKFRERPPQIYARPREEGLNPPPEARGTRLMKTTTNSGSDMHHRSRPGVIY